MSEAHIGIEIHTLPNIPLSGQPFQLIIVAISSQPTSIIGWRTKGDVSRLLGTLHSYDVEPDEKSPVSRYWKIRGVPAGDYKIEAFAQTNMGDILIKEVVIHVE